MASLNLTTQEILESIALVAGWNRTVGQWDDTMQADARKLIREGMREFFHPIDPQTGQAYTWKFLERMFVRIGEAAVTTGTVTAVDGVVTLAGGTWPTWAADGIIDIDGVQSFVASRDSATQITLDNTSIDAAALSTYTLYRWRQVLPADFGEFIGGVLYSTGAVRSRRLSSVTDTEIRLRYQTNLRQGETWMYTIQAATPSANGAQPWYIQWWPVMDEAATLYGTYRVQPEDQLDATDLADTVDLLTIQMPPQHASTLLAAILSATERYYNDAPGPHAAKFETALLRSIRFDSATPGPIGVGNGNPNVDPRKIALYTHVPDYSPQTDP